MNARLPSTRITNAPVVNKAMAIGQEPAWNTVGNSICHTPVTFSSQPSLASRPAGLRRHAQKMDAPTAPTNAKNQP